MSEQENNQPLMVGHNQILNLLALAKEVERKMLLNKRRRAYGLKVWEAKIEALAIKALDPDAD